MTLETMLKLIEETANFLPMVNAEGFAVREIADPPDCTCKQCKARAYLILIRQTLEGAVRDLVGEAK